MLTALVMVLALGILLQTLVVSYSFRRLRTGWVRGVENGMECAVLAALLCLYTLPFLPLAWLAGRSGR